MLCYAIRFCGSIINYDYLMGSTAHLLTLKYVINHYIIGIFSFTMRNAIAYVLRVVVVRTGVVALGKPTCTNQLSQKSIHAYTGKRYVYYVNRCSVFSWPINFTDHQIHTNIHKHVIRYICTQSMHASSGKWRPWDLEAAIPIRCVLRT